MPGLPLPQEAIAYLQKTQSTDGGSFYDHMTDVVMKVTFEPTPVKPAKDLSMVEVAAPLPEVSFSLT